MHASLKFDIFQSCTSRFQELDLKWRKSTKEKHDDLEK